MTDHKTNLLFCDLKTDEEKASFFLSGRGYASGVITLSIQNDVAMAYHRCSEYRKEVEALQAECENLREDAERYRWLRDRASAAGICAVHIEYWSEDYRGMAHCEVFDGEFLDKAIDKAMKGE